MCVRGGGDVSGFTSPRLTFCGLGIPTINSLPGEACLGPAEPSAQMYVKPASPLWLEGQFAASSALFLE